MNRLSRPRVLTQALLLGVLALGGLLVACDVPRPPAEALTPVVGSATRTPKVIDPNVPTATPAPMTLPATGRLWFLRGGVLWTAAPDGSGAKAVSQTQATSPPVPNGAGTQVAYLSARKLILLDVASGQETTLIEADMSPVQRPSWSPDDKQIAYFTEDAGQYGSEIVWAIPAAGGPPQRVTELKDGGYRSGPTFEHVASWAGDGRRLAVSGPMGPIHILPLAQTAGDPKVVNGGEPTWSTDNRTMLFTETLNGALALQDVVSDDFQPYINEKRLDGTRLGQYAQAPFPRFNADASLILYRAQGGDGAPAVAIRARADGSEQLFLPGNNASWAPDGQWLVYETGALVAADLGQNWQPQGLARVRADGSGQTDVLSDASWPAWSK